MASTDTRLREYSTEFLARRHNLMAFIVGMVRDRHVADDIFQDVWLQLADAVEKEVRIRDIEKWSRGVARNLILQHWRKSRTSKLVVDTELLDLVEQAFEEAETESDRLYEYGLAMQECVETLPNGQRKVLAMKYEGGRTSAEIGKELGKSTASIKMMLTRVRQGLEKCTRKKLQLNGTL